MISLSFVKFHSIVPRVLLFPKTMLLIRLTLVLTCLVHQNEAIRPAVRERNQARNSFLLFPPITGATKAGHS
jgi:hypothetical protein